MPACPNSRSEGSSAESGAESETVRATCTPYPVRTKGEPGAARRSPRFDDKVYFYYFKH
ncbi:hypothetical protein MAHJHV57_25600 [Mycobacterium avium subsp. hominissuis]